MTDTVAASGAAGHRMPSLSLERMVRQRRRLAFLLLAAFYFLIAWIGPETFLPSQANDANTIMSLSVAANDVDAFDGYGTMAFIYSITNVLLRYAIVCGLALTLFYFMIRQVQTPVGVCVIYGLALAPILLFLCYFVKDTFVIPLSIAALLIINKFYKKPIVVAIAVGAIYVFYAFLFRQYYLIIPLAFAGLLLFRNARLFGRIVLLMAIPLVISLVPDSIFIALQETRDMANAYRYEGAEGTRTMFHNLVEPSGVASFIINYAYAFIRLNFPILFSVSPKEVIMMGILVLNTFFIVLGLRNPNPRIYLPATLFFAHMLVLWIFEPDLGSYLRHLSTVILYLVPMTAQFEKGLLARKVTAGAHSPRSMFRFRAVTTRPQ